jgi:hypothetical protein
VHCCQQPGHPALLLHLPGPASCYMWVLYPGEQSVQQSRAQPHGSKGQDKVVSALAPSVSDKHESIAWSSNCSRHTLCRLRLICCC